MNFKDIKILVAICLIAIAISVALFAATWRQIAAKECPAGHYAAQLNNHRVVCVLAE